MIYSIEEYLELSNSDNKEDYDRVIREELSEELISNILKYYPEKHSWLAHNKFVSIEVLRILALDNNVDVRFTVAMKKKCDRSIFEILMKDEDFSVRMAVVRNNKLPIDLLKILISDKDSEIAEESKLILERRMPKFSK
jgi:hypothetical protein